MRDTASKKERELHTCAMRRGLAGARYSRAGSGRRRPTNGGGRYGRPIGRAPPERERCAVVVVVVEVVVAASLIDER